MSKGAGVEDDPREYLNLLESVFTLCLPKLKQSGLLEEKVKKGSKFFNLTQKGRNKLSQLDKRNKEAIPDNFYNKGKSNQFVIIIFDIPEIERKKRSWLRSALVNLGFRMIQKSVWVGKIKIPEEFLKDLSKLRMIDFVEIFEISKAGSLKQIA